MDKDLKSYALEFAALALVMDDDFLYEAVKRALVIVNQNGRCPEECYEAFRALERGGLIAPEVEVTH